MTIIKKSIIAGMIYFLSISCASSELFAQSDNNNTKAKQSALFLGSKLNLNEEQMKKLELLNLELEQAILEVKSRTEFNKEKFRRVIDRREKELKVLFTEEQFERYKKMLIANRQPIRKPDTVH